MASASAPHSPSCNGAKKSCMHSAWFILIVVSAVILSSFAFVGREFLTAHIPNYSNHLEWIADAFSGSDGTGLGQVWVYQENMYSWVQTFVLVLIFLICVATPDFSPAIVVALLVLTMSSLDVCIHFSKVICPCCHYLICRKAFTQNPSGHLF